jgi:hypothetical protein
MIAIWAVISALSLAWFAGDAVLGLMVAPRLFVHAREAGLPDTFPGLIFGDLLERWVTFAGLLCVIPLTCLLASVAGRQLKLFGKRAVIVPLGLCMLVLGAHIASVQVVKIGLDTAASLREHPDPERAAAFKTTYHSLSRAVFSAEMLLALGLSVGAIIAIKRGSKPSKPA